MENVTVSRGQEVGKCVLLEMIRRFFFLIDCSQAIGSSENFADRGSATSKKAPPTPIDQQSFNRGISIGNFGNH